MSISHTKQSDPRLDKELRDIIAAVADLEKKLKVRTDATVDDSKGAQGVVGLKLGARTYSIGVPTQDGYVRLVPGLLLKQTKQDPPTPVSGQILIGKADGTYIPAHLTGGTNISITNEDGSITIAGVAYTGPTDVRAGSGSISTGGTTLTFSSAMSDTTYALVVNCWKTEGGIYYSNVGYNITARGTTGFTIVPVEDCTCEYVALDYT